MFKEAYKKAFAVIGKKPMMLWGLSLLSSLICTIACGATALIPVVGIVFSYVISVGMSKVYLDGLEGKEVNSDQLFSGFSRFWRVAGGMAWHALWRMIWFLAGLAIGVLVFAVIQVIGLISWRLLGAFTIIGIVFGSIAAIIVWVYAVTKSYSYSFVPYILATEPDVTATEALRLSMKRTKGKKSAMFLADLLFVLAVILVEILLALFGSIPFLGVLFKIVGIAFGVALVLFSGIFSGLYHAAFYTMPCGDANAASTDYQV